MSFRPHIESQSFMVKSELETSASGTRTMEGDDRTPSLFHVTNDRTHISAGWSPEERERDSYKSY